MTRYIVDGIGEDGMWMAADETTTAPFVVFDSDEQKNLPTLFAHRADAEIVASGLNKRDT